MHRPIIDHVELVDAEIPAPLDVAAAGSTGPQIAIVLAIVAALAAGWVALGLSATGESTTAPAPRTIDATTTTTAVSLRSTVMAQQRSLKDFMGWPAPPEDHDPHVIGRPGSGTPLLVGAPTEQTLVYVSTLGRPVVVDLDTGATQEVDIAASRTYDEFAIEMARVVSLTGESRSQDPASEDAVVFQVYRGPIDSSLGAADVRSLAVEGPHLCLTVEPCPVIDTSIVSMSNSTTRIDLVNGRDHPEIAALLSGDGWRRDRDWFVDPPDVDFEFRLPVPLHDEAWVISPTR